jgi:arylsulfatase A-like enzyme
MTSSARVTLRAMLLAGLLVAGTSCRGDGVSAGSAQPSTWRLLDHTTSANVILSPMIGVDDGLEAVEQRLTAVDLLPTEDQRGRAIWAACLSSAPVVGLAHEPPLGMELLHDGRPVAHGVTVPAPSYTFTRTRLALQADFRRGPDDPPLTDEDRSLTRQWEVLLPDGPVTIEVRATRGQALAAEHRLELGIDGTTVSTIHEIDEGGVQLSHGVGCGEHRLALTLVQPESPTARRDPRFLPMIRVEVTSPSGLMQVHPEETWLLDEAELTVRWLADRRGSGAGQLAALARRWPLTDPGAGEDVYGTKKKLSGSTASHSVLLAPSPGELRYDVRVPTAGRLRLGGGVHPPGATDGPAASFEVFVEADGVSERVFHHRTRDGRAEPFEDTVDLSGYGGRSIALVLRTSAGTEDGARHLATYWTDPRIYAPAVVGSPRPPNVVLVSIDTLGARHLPLSGYVRDTSPALRSLAADATVFLGARAQYPTTAVSHMSMFTSRLPHRSERALRVDFGVGHDDGALDEPTLAGLLRQGGWSTGAITGGGALHHALGFDHGFDTYASCDEDDSPRAMGARADAWIRGHADQPFFLFLHTYQVHGPYAPPAPYNGTFSTAAEPYVSLDPMAWLEPDEVCRPVPAEHHSGLVSLYDGEILYTDQELIGPLVELLKELELYDDTLLIVTSDHGEEFGEHGCWTHGANLYDETLHVPLVIRFPGGAHAGTEVAEVVGLVDVLPTVLAATAVDPGSLDAHGRDLAAVLRGEPAGETVAMRLTPVALPGGPAEVGLEEFTLVQGTHKLIVAEHPRARFAGDGSVDPSLTLYDLSTDPAERDDIADLEPALAEELLRRARSYYDPEQTLGQVGVTATGAGGQQWKEHMRGLGYIDAVD